MRMVGFSALGIAITLAVFASTARSESRAAEGMDRPLKEQVVDFGPSPYCGGGRVRIKLTCDFYAKLLAKEYDAGRKGAEWLSFTPLQKAGAPAVNLPFVSVMKTCLPHQSRR